MSYDGLVSALDDLRAALQAEVERSTRPAIVAIHELRAALEHLEVGIRHEAEIAVSLRAAQGAGVVLDVCASDAEARRAAVDAATRLLAILDAPNEPDLAEAADGEPPDEAPEPEVASARAVTPEELRAWTASAREPGAAKGTAADPQRERQVLRALVERIGAPPALDTDIAIIDELDRLDEISAEDQLERWSRLSLPVQRTWIAHLVARGRAVRDAVAALPSLRIRVREVLVRFPTFAATTRPGFINGMSPEHGPYGASWTADAAEHFKELRELAGLDRAEARTAAPAQTRKKRRDGDAAIADPGHTPRRVDPALRARCAGLRALLFGGTPREDARATLEAELGFAELNWPQSDKPRRLDGIVGSITRGNYDLVLVTRLVHHAESNRIVEAARDARTPFAFVETGYGLEAVSQAALAALDGTSSRSARAS